MDLSWKLTELLLSVVFTMYGKCLKNPTKAIFEIGRFPIFQFCPTFLVCCTQDPI